ncbi:MAG: TIGR01777 family oxidoreductase [Bacteroidales bacterium]|nr:TIGR01777 family oxidoreductase [Bacteroidales bacterium]MCF8455384.1 TIGR01777 family oxidoreductase [Bacteroidales bacterium]
MRVVISGASGLIGSALKEMFEAEGHEVVPLGRKHFKRNIHEFKEFFREADVLINLAGAPLLKRWTQSYKRKLRSSRVDTSEKIYTAFKLLKDRPLLYIAASAIGIYETSEKIHSEESQSFDPNFVGHLVQDWEKCNLQFTGLHNIRVVIMRLGVVLAKKGGAFPTMARPFKMGVGGRIGKGMQPLSFIHIKDLMNAIQYFINNKNANGIYNLVAPKPVTNKEFSKALGKVLKRPSFFIVPPFILRLLYGEASSIMVNAPWVIPEKLQSNGFKFDYPDIESALGDLTQKHPGG